MTSLILKRVKNFDYRKIDKKEEDLRVRFNTYQNFDYRKIDKKEEFSHIKIL